MKLKTKLPLLFIPLLAAPLLLAGTLLYFQLKGYAQQKSIEEVSTLLAQVEEQIDRSVDTAKANVELTAQDKLVRNYLLTDDEEERYTLLQRPLQQKVVSIQTVYPEYFEIRILLPDGFEDLRVVNPYIDNVTEEEGETPYFATLQKSQSDLLSRLRVNPDNGELTLYVSKRIALINPATESYNAEPTLRGYLIVAVNFGALNTLIKNSSWGGEGGLMLTDATGEIWSNATGIDSIREKLKSHIDREKQNLHGDDHFHDLQLSGQRFYYKYVELKSGFGLHALLPENEVLAASRQVALIVGSILLLALVVAVPLLIFLLKIQILTPILRLRTALTDVGSGNSLVTVPVNGKDEFSDLNNAFNTMSLELHDSNERIRNLAFNDTLTGLPNRLMFFKTLKREMEVSRRGGFTFALLFIDLDNFKHINDTLGHYAGDKLLQDVATRLTDNLRDYDCVGLLNTQFGEVTLARLGGDEFTVLLSQLSSPLAAGQIAQRIIDLLRLPLEINGQQYYIGASIGISVFPGDGSSVEELIKSADLAMYHAKKGGKNSYQYITEAIGAQSKKRMQLDQKLHKAIEDGAFELYYQPILDCSNRRTNYLEALIRWNDPELGFIPPDEFIPLAEESGKIIAIGDWVIEEAVKQLDAWRGEGLGHIKVTINVSGIQLGKPDFVEHLTKTLRARNIAPQSIFVELTETAVIKGKQEVLETLKQLRDLGIKVALDDFGTGYSSLGYLKNLPIDILKIDRSFIAKIEEQDSSTILSAIITMAHALNLEVVAEGIEEQSQVTFLNKEGCDFMQGYMFSRPRPAGEIAAYLYENMAGGTELKTGSR
ncbi:MAG: bifunctional diguanylate cyclase/phosphodiesterase [Pseudomonadales bacterium]